MKLTTPFSHMIDILSSTPLIPLGIFVKSSLPRAFCSVLKVQLSVPVSCRSPLYSKKDSIQSYNKFDSNFKITIGK